MHRGDHCITHLYVDVPQRAVLVALLLRKIKRYFAELLALNVYLVSDQVPLFLGLDQLLLQLLKEEASLGDFPLLHLDVLPGLLVGLIELPDQLAVLVVFVDEVGEDVLAVVVLFIQERVLLVHPV